MVVKGESKSRRDISAAEKRLDTFDTKHVELQSVSGSAVLKPFYFTSSFNIISVAECSDSGRTGVRILVRSSAYSGSVIGLISWEDVAFVLKCRSTPTNQP